jgi:two-component system, cell cycle response regulator DivK
MSRSVLLIEDNEQNRYLVTFLLERVPALVLLDIQLPTMDGYAVARALRQNQALRGTPIVAVTSYAMPGDREKALEAGCTGYIEKPINPETFVDEVERALSAARQGDS